MWRIKTYLTFACVVLGSVSQAAASILDTDPNCIANGCVVISDGRGNTNIYDVCDTNGCVANGEKLIARPLNSINDLNLTGTQSAAPPPGNDEMMMLAIVDGAQNTVVSFLDDGDGFLDAGDSLSAFTLDATTQVKLDDAGQNYSHSFYISSRNIKFSMRGFVSHYISTGDLSNSITLSDIDIIPKVTKKGTDAGVKFGDKANGGGIKFNNQINTLNDLTGVPAEFAETKPKKGIRKKAGDLIDQSVRFDFLYQIPDYDMSMGTGSLIVDVEFEFYKE